METQVKPWDWDGVHLICLPECHAMLCRGGVCCPLSFCFVVVVRFLVVVAVVVVCVFVCVCVCVCVLCI